MTNVLIYLSNTGQHKKIEEKFSSKLDEVLKGAEYHIAHDQVSFKTYIREVSPQYVLIDSEGSIPYLIDIKANVFLLSSDKSVESRFPDVTLSTFPGLTQLLNWLPAAKLSNKVIDSTSSSETRRESGESGSKKEILHERDNSPGHPSVKKGNNNSQEGINVSKPSPSATIVNKDKTETQQAPQSSNSKDIENIEILEENEQVDYFDRARQLVKSSYKRTTRDGNKTIGVWSPLYRMGVSTFTINFAIFLGKHKIESAVLEGLNNRYSLKNYLKKMRELPEDWKSYATLLHNKDLTDHKIAIPYHNVFWMPMDSNDLSYTWNIDSLNAYINGVKYYDMLLVDLPTGKLEEHTLHTLSHLDEIWIIVDNNFQQVAAWKDYIHKIIKDNELDAHLIFNKKLKFSQVQRTTKELEIPILCEMPALYEEVDKNNFESIPLIDHEDVYSKLAEPFNQLGKHLVGNSFAVKDYTRPPSRWLNKFRSIFPALKA
jgi:hypothetical protein